MQAYRVNTTIQEDGTLTVSHLPLQAGEVHLPQTHRMYLETHEAEGFGLSIISCWEVAK